MKREEEREEKEVRMNMSKVNSNVLQMQTNRTVCFGELVLPLIIVMNSLGVVLMLYSGTGISAISSMTYALSQVLPKFSLGTWTYIFQGSLVCSLMILRKRFMPQYLLSFAVGFTFGNMVDIHKSWVALLPTSVPFRVLYFVISYLIICTGIALSNRCKMPIIPTDLFPKELSEITGIPYAKIKMTFDIICIVVTMALTLGFIGGIRGLGIGTVLSAMTTGKGVAVIGEWIDRHIEFITISDVDRHVNKRITRHRPRVA